MEAAIGLVGVALALCSRRPWTGLGKADESEERRSELLEATDGFVAASGDALQAEWGTDSDQDAWKSGVGFRAMLPGGDWHCRHLKLSPAQRTRSRTQPTG